MPFEGSRPSDTSESLSAKTSPDITPLTATSRGVISTKDNVLSWKVVWLLTIKNSFCELSGFIGVSALCCNHAAPSGRRTVLSYMLEGGEMKNHVGHKVEISGIKIAENTMAMDHKDVGGTLKVKAVKMISASCK